MKASEFINQEFESENDTLFTFIGHGGYFCIMLNAKCIHSVKTKRLHIKKLNQLIEERNLVQVIN